MRTANVGRKVVMGRGVNRLSPARVKTVKTPGMYPDGANLYLRVEQGPLGPTKSWLFRYVIGGRQRYMGVGPLRDVPLADARAAALAARQQLRDGHDPIEIRKARIAENRLASIKAMTFEEAARACIASHSAGWRNVKHGLQVRKTIETYALPIIGKLPVQAIDTALVLKIIEPIWETKTETASRLRGRIEAVLDWAKARGLRAGENPARWDGHLDHLLPAKGKLRKVQHLRALPYAEVAAFMTELRKDTAISARALEFLILTATRSGEVLGARWPEIDLDARVWTIPAERTKAHREHRVPLSDRAIQILAELHQSRTCEFVFPGRSFQKPLGQMSLLQVIERLGRTDDATAHGFRSTFRTWVAERTNFQREVGEAALGHVNGDRVEASYQRGDLFEKRRRLMDAWAAHCAKPAAASGEVVTTIGRRSA
jgi:integrase